MSSTNSPEHDQIQQILGARDEHICRLKRQLVNLRERWKSDVKEWQRLQRHRDELAEWLVDRATDDLGRLTKPVIDAGLIGESFVPCSFAATIQGRRFQINLVRTDYEVSEVAGNA